MPFLRDRSGAVIWIKVIALTGTLLPALWLLYRIWSDDLGARPVTECIHFVGDWIVRLLWITLAVTPFARIFKWSRLLLTRRILGVATFCYALAHFSLYIVDQKFKLGVVASEIALRFYLTIGFVALTGLAALAITSTDAMVRRLGGKSWNRLHLLVYPIAFLALWHYFLQSKNDVSNPVLMFGYLIWLFGYRTLAKYFGEVTLPRLFGLAVVAGTLTALGETAWYHFASGVDAWRVLQANLDFSYIIRPAWWVLWITLAIPVAAWLWKLRPQKARKTVAKPSSGKTQAQSAS